jgi:hypothetical protein
VDLPGALPGDQWLTQGPPGRQLARLMQSNRPAVAWVCAPHVTKSPALRDTLGSFFDEFFTGDAMKGRGGINYGPVLHLLFEQKRPAFLFKDHFLTAYVAGPGSEEANHLEGWMLAATRQLEVRMEKGLKEGALEGMLSAVCTLDDVCARLEQVSGSVTNNTDMWKHGYVETRC